MVQIHEMILRDAHQSLLATRMRSEDMLPIADKLDHSIEYIRNMLSSLSSNQKRKKWLIINLNKRYVFFNEQAVEIFKDLYRRGYNDKKILENMQQEMRIRSRSEIKAIETTLTNQNRLNTQIRRSINHED